MAEIAGAVAEPEIGTDIGGGGSDVVDVAAEITPEIESGAEDVNQEGSDTEKPVLTEQPAAKAPITLENLAKTHRDALKAIDPALPGKIRDIVFADQALKREFPGGLKEAVQARDALGELGGPEGVKEYRAALTDYVSLETMFEKGDPQFILRLAEEGPQSFAAMMPTGIEQWKKADPEMYTHTMARVMMNTLDAQNVSQNLAAIWKASDKPEVKAAIEEVWNLLESYRGVASKTPEKKTDPNAERWNRKEQEIAARELKLLMAPVEAAGDQRIASVAQREMSQSYQWDQTDTDVKQAVLDRVRTELGKQLGKNPAYTGPRDRMKAAGNVDGLKKHVQAHFDRAIPQIVQKAAKLFNVKPKNAGNGAAKKPPVAAGTQKAAVQGWTHWNKPTPPSIAELNRQKTTDDMVMDGKFILKDGRQVLWP